ncbi:hypothetical protein Tco_0615089 [Tanacetum coccineum]
MLIDALLHHEVEGRVDRLVEEVEELESKRAEMLDELAIKVAEEVDEVIELMEALTKCSYKDFVACKPKESDGKGGAVAYIRWVKKIEEIQDISDCGYNQKRSLKPRGRMTGAEDFKALMKEKYCPSNEIQKLETEFWNHAMVGAGSSAYTDRFHELSRLVPHLVTPETKRIKARVLTDEAVRNGSLKRNGKKRGKSSKEGNVRGDNKKARTGKVFGTITKPVRKENTGVYECSGKRCSTKSACPRLNRAPGQGGNRLNQAMAIEGGQGRGNNGNLARRRAFIMGAGSGIAKPKHYVGMTKVIKGEFEKIKDVKVEDIPFTCDASLEVFNDEISRLSKMDNDLSTYEVKIDNIPCDSKMDNDSKQEVDDDIGYDLSDVAFIEWLRSKNFNYKTIDHYTMKALWIYWIRGDDEVELTDEESSDNDDEIAKVFMIDTNIFDYETPLCSAFNEFNYLLKVDEKPWTDIGIWNKPTPVKHTCKPLNYKTGCSEWPTCGWKDNGYCNGGNLPGAYIIRNQLHYQNYEWYEALEDCKLKDEALRNKAIMEGSIKEDDDESQQPECNIRRYMMIKYLFNDDEEYVAVKEDEYDDLTVTRKEAFRAYQEIF